MKPGAAPVITLLTDFGTADYFVAAVKGVILTINPQVSLVDITHEVPPQDIESGAFTLLTCYSDFPSGTIHVGVVDPGVGSARRGIVVRAGSYYFVGPDNGLFSYICDREPSFEVFELTAEKYFRPSPSSSFHGRDVFAPVAAALSTGVKPNQFGPQIENAVRLAPLAPVRDRDGSLRGRIIHIDHFGNCITNFTRTDLPDSSRFELRIKRRVIRTVRKFFADIDSPAGKDHSPAGKGHSSVGKDYSPVGKDHSPAGKDHSHVGKDHSPAGKDHSQAGKHESRNDLFAIWGSAGFLELSINGGSAASVLRAYRGDPVVLS